MEIVLLIVWVVLGALALIGLKRKLLPQVPAAAVLLLWLVKIAAGSAIWLIYSGYYSDEKTGDVISYHADGRTLLEVWRQDPAKYVAVLLGIHDNYEEDFAPLYNTMRYWYEEWRGSNLIIESRNMIRLSSLVSLITGGLPLAHTIFFSFLSLAGALFLVRGFHEAGIKAANGLLLSAAVLCPSVLAWTSAAMREAPLMLGLGMATAGAVSLKKGLWRSGLLLSLGGFWWLVYFKTHVALTLTLPFMLYLISGSKVRRILVTHAVAAAALVVFIYATPAGDVVLHVVAKKRTDFINVAEVWEARSRIPVPEVPRQIADVPLSALQALSNTFFQPFPWKVRGLLDGVAVLENLIFIALVILSALNRRFFVQAPLDFTLMILSYALLQGLLIGYTTSVAGAIVRYKVSVLTLLVPFLAQGLGGLLPNKGAFRSGVSP